MILAEFGNSRITLEEFSKYLKENEYSEFFIESVISNLNALKIFLKECIKNNYEIDFIQLLKCDKKNKIKMGFKFKNIEQSELLDKYPYLYDNSSFIFFLDTYYYSKNLFDYSSKTAPYIKTTN